MENNCSDCKHWAKGTHKNIGKCLLSKSKTPIMFSPCGLFTREDFGCKLFEKRIES